MLIFPSFTTAPYDGKVLTHPNPASLLAFPLCESAQHIGVLRDDVKPPRSFTIKKPKKKNISAETQCSAPPAVVVDAMRRIWVEIVGCFISRCQLHTLCSAHL